MDKIKLDKNFFDKLNVAVERQYFAGKKTLLGMFDLINTNIVDNKIDKKEFVNFANSILTADTNGDTIIDGSELELYIKNNADKFKEQQITPDNILEFFNIFKSVNDKNNSEVQSNKEEINNIITQITDYSKSNNLSPLEAAQKLYPNIDVSFSETFDSATPTLYPVSEKNQNVLSFNYNGRIFYYISYNDGTNETVYPDGTSTATNKRNTIKYHLDSGEITSIEFVRISKHIYADENGNYTGYAREGESLNQVLKNFGIEPNSEEADEFIKLNAANIKTFKNVRAFVVGSQMIIPNKYALKALQYIMTDPEIEKRWYKDGLMNNIRDYAESCMYTLQPVEKNTSWWETAKNSLIKEGIKNPSNEQISLRSALIRALNDDCKLIAGNNIKMPISEKDILKMLPGKYRPENIEKIYPKDKYNIEFDKVNGYTSVTDKTTGKPVFTMFLSFDERYNETKVNINKYNKNGDLIFSQTCLTNGVVLYQSEQKGNKKVFAEYDRDGFLLGQNGDFYSTSKLMFNVFDKFLKKEISEEFLLKKIEEYSQKIKYTGIYPAKEPAFIHRLFIDYPEVSNTLKNKIAKIIIDNYLKNCKPEIYEQEDIKNALNIGTLTKNNIVSVINALRRIDLRTHPHNVLKPIEANGKIDADFAQGSLTDCWLISGIKALTNNPKGLTKLNELLTKDENGNITVHLKGVNKKFTITKEELERYTEYASGDLDVRVIELAMQKYDNSPNSPIGADIKHLISILFEEDDFKVISLPLEDAVSAAGQKNPMITVTNCRNSDIKGKAINTVTGETVDLFTNHAYTLVSSDNKYTYFYNPHNTSQLLKMPINDFIDFFDGAEKIQ